MFEHILHQALEMVHATVWRDVLAASGAGGCRISGYNENWVIYGGVWLAPGTNVSAVQEFYKCNVYVLLDLEHSFVAVLGQHCVEFAEKLAKLDFHRL